jgi:rsbT co-antagonist protein RsbR
MKRKNQRSETTVLPDQGGRKHSSLGDGEPALLHELVSHLREHRAQLREEWARRISNTHLLVDMSQEEVFSEATAVYDNYVEVLETGNVEALQAYARDLSGRIIPRGIETHEVIGIVLLLRDVLARSLFKKYQGDFELLNRVLDAYEPAANRIANTVAVSFVRERERIIRQQQEAIRELSTPVLPVRERLLILPISGVIDSQRARQLTEKLLNGIRDHRAKVVVVDVTGVPTIDSTVANHLVQTVEASRLMGASVIITGLSSGSAQALVTLGVDLSKMHPVGDLRGGLEKAELRQSEEHFRTLFERACAMQQNLRELSHKVLHAQEEERKRISRELHDETSQALTAISVTLASLNNSCRNGVTRRKRIRDAQRLLQETMESLHNFARELRPASIDELGLLPALRSWLKNFSARTGLQVSFRASPAAEQLDANQRLTLYRVMQESLTNVAKHAKASRVDFVIRKLPDRICMTISDNGKSFQPASGPPGNGQQRLGLLGMKERVRLINGELQIEPRLGKGTTLQLAIPLNSHGSVESRYLMAPVRPPGNGGAA